MMKIKLKWISLFALSLLTTQEEKEAETTEEKLSVEKAPEKEATEAEAPKQEAAPAPKLDFGDHSSQTLTAKAWEALSAKNHQAVAGYTGKCIELFEKQAIEMQGKLNAPAPAASAHDHWALNDVSTCYLIRAQSKEATGDTDGALADYKVITEKFSFGQCWDVNGWFWKPVDAAKVKIKEIAFDTEE